MVAIGLVAPLPARPIRRRRLLLLSLQRTVYKDKLLLANKVKSGRTDYGPQSHRTQSQSAHPFCRLGLRSRDPQTNTRTRQTTLKRQQQYAASNATYYIAMRHNSTQFICVYTKYEGEQDELVSDIKD